MDAEEREQTIHWADKNDRQTLSADDIQYYNEQCELASETVTWSWHANHMEAENNAGKHYLDLCRFTLVFDNTKPKKIFEKLAVKRMCKDRRDSKYIFMKELRLLHTDMHEWYESMELSPFFKATILKSDLLKHVDDRYSWCSWPAKC